MTVNDAARLFADIAEQGYGHCHLHTRKDGMMVPITDFGIEEHETPGGRDTLVVTRHAKESDDVEAVPYDPAPLKTRQ